MQHFYVKFGDPIPIGFDIVRQKQTVRHRQMPVKT